jgi:hypothetical protein
MACVAGSLCYARRWGGDKDRLSSVLLDIVPNAKDLDAIDFRIDLYPDMDSLRSYISGTAAEIAKPIIDAL